MRHNGYTQAILISGHYPNRSQYLDAGVQAYLQAGGAIRVLALVENQAPGVEGNHAAKYETSSMIYLDPPLVNMAALQGQPDDDIGGPAAKVNWMGDDYRGHPCYGLVGIDPRGHASAAVGEAGTTLLIDFLVEWLG